MGLIRHLAGVTGRSILLSDAFPFKGQLTENYVLEQLQPLTGSPPNFFAYAQDREIDFLIQHDESIIPIEVKSGENKNTLSFKRYIERHKPEAAVRLSTNEYRKDGAITDIPLYLAGKIFELME